MHKSSLDNMKAFRDKYLINRREEPLSIIDLGSLDVNGTYREYFDIPPWRYRGADISAGGNVDMVLHDLYNWREVRSGSTDVLISGQTFEHIEFFWLTILEIARILTPGGLCCLIAPSSGFEHRYPVDCWRFYHDGFAALARFASLDVLEIYSQDETIEYDDGSDTWQDMVLVCQKPVSTSLSVLKKRCIHYLLRQLL